MDKKADIMVITAHPDDSEFGAAGTIARWTREGKIVVYIVCTNGDKGSSDTAIAPEKLVKIREQEQLEAARVLGVSRVVFLHYHDQELEDTPEFRKELVRQIRIFRPDTVLTSDPYRHRYIWHRDHRIAGQAALDAIYPYARDFLAYPDLWKEGLQPHKVKDVFLWASEEPNYWSDITESFDTKIAALRCHKSQVGDMPDLESWMRDWAKEAARGENFELAEAFHHEEIMM